MRVGQAFCEWTLMQQFVLDVPCTFKCVKCAAATNRGGWVCADWLLVDRHTHPRLAILPGAGRLLKKQLSFILK